MTKPEQVHHNGGYPNGQYPYEALHSLIHCQKHLMVYHCIPITVAKMKKTASCVWEAVEQPERS